MNGRPSSKSTVGAAISRPPGLCRQSAFFEQTRLRRVRADVGASAPTSHQATVLLVGARIARPNGFIARALAANATSRDPAVGDISAAPTATPPSWLRHDPGLPLSLPGPHCGPPRQAAAQLLRSLHLPQAALPCRPHRPEPNPGGSQRRRHSGVRAGRRLIAAPTATPPSWLRHTPPLKPCGR